MKGKIGLEEHFAIDDTLNDSKGFFPDDIWVEVRDRIIDLHGRRLRLMDEFGMRDDDPVAERAGDPGHPRRQEGQRDRPQGQRLSGRAGAQAPRPLPGAGRAAAAGPRHGGEGAAALRQGARHGRRAGQRLLADRRSEHDRLSRREAVLAVLGACATQLDVPFYLHPRNPLPQDARIYKGARMADGPDLGVRPRDRGACAAADGLGPVRQASEAADRPRPHGRRPAVQHVARRQLPTPGFRTATTIRRRKRSANISRTTSTSPCRATSAPRRCSTR